MVYKTFLCGFRVDIDTPKVEVRFENLFVEGDAFNGSRALPTLVNSTMNAIEVLLTPSFVSSLLNGRSPYTIPIIVLCLSFLTHPSYSLYKK